jgi:50S ribosomal subunit-associated GTPase HflX
LDDVAGKAPWSALRAVRLHHVYVLPERGDSRTPGPALQRRPGVADRDAAPGAGHDRRPEALSDRTRGPARARRRASICRIPRARVGPELAEFVALAQAAGASSSVRSCRSCRTSIRQRSSAAARRTRSPSAPKSSHADVLFVFNDLRPRQRTNLEKIVPLPIVDRTMLILDIFAQHARSREGQLQVELAQLRYRQSNLIGAGAALSRLGGGVGTRGPGETKLEVDRRKIQQRVSLLQRSARRRAQAA